MKRLKKFSYYEPTSIKEATALLAEKGGSAYPLAGGTDLMVRMKRGEIIPEVIVNLKRISDLNEINTVNGEGTFVGALASIAAIENSAAIQTDCPVLSQAAGVLGSQSIRNLATIGGNIGRASPASDMAPALIVHKARIRIEGPAGEREMDIEKIFAGPGQTNLTKAEIITSFFVPETAPNTGAAYLKLGRRGGGGDCALVGIAALITLNKDEVKDTRIALSSVGPNPLRAKQAEAVILSGPLSEERMKAAARVAADETSPITDMRCSAAYREEMVKVLTFRALKAALQRIRGEIS